MANDSIKFSLHNLILDGKKPDAKLFEKVPSSFTIVSDDGASGIAKFENGGNYLWMTVRSGKSHPYGTEVLNTRTQACEVNPRTPEQAELRSQGYCMYLFESGLLYVASGLEYFKKMMAKLNPGIQVRNLYKTRDEIIDSVRRIDKVRLVAEEDLFSTADTIFSVPKNSLGLGNPNQVKVELKFPHASVTERFKSFIRQKGFSGCDCGAWKNLTVAGDFEDGDRIISSVFNLKSLESSIFVQVSKNDSGLYNDDEVKSSLLAQIL